MMTLGCRKVSECRGGEDSGADHVVRKSISPIGRLAESWRRTKRAEKTSEEVVKVTGLTEM